MTRYLICFILFCVVCGFCAGCAGTHYQTQTSASYLFPANDMTITTTVVVHN